MVLKNTLLCPRYDHDLGTIIFEKSSYMERQANNNTYTRSYVNSGSVSWIFGYSGFELILLPKPSMMVVVSRGQLVV